MPTIQPRRTRRRGFSFLELQVSFLLFAIAVSGIMPLVVMQSKQLQQLESRFDDDTTYYLQPSDSLWARKLGAAASVVTAEPGPPASPPVMVIDNGDPGYSETGPNWHDHARTKAYHDQLRCNNKDNVGEIAEWQFTGLAAGWYEVLVTYEEIGNQATDAPYTIFDGAVVTGTATVNQEVAPSGEIFDGQPWESLGVFGISGDTLTVLLGDDGNEKVVADGVRIVPVRNEVHVTSLDKSLTSEEVTAHTVITLNTP